MLGARTPVRPPITQSLRSSTAMKRTLGFAAGDCATAIPIEIPKHVILSEAKNPEARRGAYMLLDSSLALRMTRLSFGLPLRLTQRIGLQFAGTHVHTHPSFGCLDFGSPSGFIRLRSDERGRPITP